MGDRLERDDRKRAQYVKLIGNAARSDEQIQNATTFIQTLEQLNEIDLAILRILNKVMNQPSDWKSPTSANDVWKVNPTVFTNRAGDLAMQIAIALGQGTETNMYSREEGYSICNRLQGFGLAHEPHCCYVL